ncbi:MAG: repeat protein [Acidobacteriaceae bacterium]|nr:repeat protein [Acidobacteriaceae bacterium]
MFKKAFCTLLFAALIACSLSATPQEPNPAQSLLSAGRVDDAIALLQRQLAGNKDNAEDQNLLARAYYAEEVTDKAIQAGERAIELAPQNSVYHLWIGRIYGQKAERVMALRAAGFAGKVRDQFEKAVQLDPNNMEARADLAEFYVEAPGFMGGGKDKARAQADAIASKNPAVAHWIQALAANKDKNYAEAEKEYKAAIDASGGRAEQWLNLASFYQQRNRTPEMLDALNKAVAAPRRSSAIFFDAAGLLFHANQKLLLAAELDNKYLAAKDKSEEAPAFKAHLLLGQIMEKQGDTAGAVKQYQAALALARDFAPARDALKKLQK